MAPPSRAQAILALMAGLPAEPLSLDDITAGLEHAEHDFGPTGGTPERRRALTLRTLTRMTDDGRLTKGTVADFDVWSRAEPATGHPRTADTPRAARPGATRPGATPSATTPRATPRRPVPRPQPATTFGLAVTALTLAALGTLGTVGYSRTPDEHAPRVTPGTTDATSTATTTSALPPVATTTPPEQAEQDQDPYEQDYSDEDFTTDTVITVPAADGNPECVLVYGHTPDGQEWVETDCPTAP